LTAEYPDRVWLNPPKFWAATRNMSKEEASAFFDHVYSLAEQRDFENLQRYDFIQIGNPYKRDQNQA
jgi:hypothetical protein